MDIRFEGVDSFNRPVFKSIDSNYRFGSVDTLFSHSDTEEFIVKYFKNNLEELEYFGRSFGCEPIGGMLSNVKLKISAG